MADGYIGLHARRSGIKTSFAIDAAAALTTDLQVSAPGLVSGLRAFAAGHGGATAVIEYAGRKGARIVLVGEDGAPGDEQYAESTEAARAACAKAGVQVEHEWERELGDATRVTSDLWGARSRRALTR
ncbi:MAG TPA: hypothetical protein VH561_22940 [Micromonosporaceae bacterium]|jgi:hypothetical protein